MPLSESGSDSSGSYESSSSESESSSGEINLMRPVFLKKSKNSTSSSTDPAASQNTALDMAERLHQVEQKTLEKIPFDGVDDTDNIDPKAEYEAWQNRERARRERDIQRVREVEEAKEDAIRRKL